MDHATLIKLMREYDFMNNTKKSFREKYNISLKTINKYLIKYDIPHRRNLNIIKINRDKNGRFTFGIFEKPETNDGKIVASSKEGKPEGSIIRKVYYQNSNNNLLDKQKENRSDKKFDYISFIDNLEEFD